MREWKGQEWDKGRPPVSGGYAVWGPPAGGSLHTWLHQPMPGRDARQLREIGRQLGQLPRTAPPSAKQARLQILKGWALPRWEEHLKQEGSQATLDPDTDRNQAKCPWLTVQDPGLLSSVSFPHWQIPQLICELTTQLNLRPKKTILTSSRNTGDPIIRWFRWEAKIAGLHYLIRHK